MADEDVEDIILLAEDDEEQRDKLLGTTIGSAIVDSGCTKTVCGDVWLNTYLDSLSQKDRKLVYTEKSLCNFRFGIGKVYSSSRIVYIPVHIGSSSATLATYAIPCNIPFLLSRSSMKKAHATLDFEKDHLIIFDEIVRLIITESGHYCLPLSRPIDEPYTSSTQKVLFTSPLQEGNLDDCRKKILKLHKQFSHPHPDKLKTLIKQAGDATQDMLDMVTDVTKKCDICKRYKRTPLRPVVSFPLATEFNETVALDLKTFHGSGYMLHMIDHATRYSQACFIKNKQSSTIVKSILQFWISIFGSPRKFLSDNGGEFVNQEFNELAEKFNISVLTTAAESPWSNGLCEKHNGIIADMIQKTMNDGVHELELAIHWCVAAKNSLQNVYGYSPNQLVFGRNPNYPAVYSDHLPAQNQSTMSEHILRNLRALHISRESFIKQESCERLRRALLKKTRNVDHFSNGDAVYYKRNNQNEWHGPAKVLGRDTNQYLLKHGGIYIRVHPCRMQLTNAEYGNHIEEGRHNLNHNIAADTVKDHHAVDNCDDDDEDEETPEGVNPPTPPPSPAIVPNHGNNLNEAEEDVDNSEETSNEDNADSGDTTTLVKSAKDLPRPKTTISFRNTPNDDWTHAEVVSRAGKTTTGNWHFMNIRQDGKDDAVCVSLKGAEWKVQEEQPIMEDIFFGYQGVRFHIEKAQEIKKWKDMGVFEEVEDIGQARISCRWVCTEKMKGDKLIRKARLCARGFEETNEQTKTDSPTCQKESLRLLLCILAANSWTLHTMDIKSAYLQGIPLDRELYMSAPKEAATQKLWRLRKCTYGLSDAGRHWYIKVVTELKSLGATQPRLDQALFVWYNTVRDCDGIMAIHVDDFIYGGTSSFINNTVSHLRTLFKVGLEESGGMKYLGISISQHATGIQLSTDAYCSSLNEILDVGTDKDRRLNEAETRTLRHVSGQLNWVTTQTRPDVAYDNCIVGNSITKATVRDVTIANKAIRKAKARLVSLNYSIDFDLKSICIIGYTDASFGNLSGGGSQGAFIIFLVDSSGRASPVTWQSRRIRRAANSTLAAECIAAVEAAEACIHLQTLLKEILHQSNAEINMMPISILCDNRSLVDAVQISTAVQNRRLQIEVGILREMLQKSELEEFRWISTELQVANALTKAGCSGELLCQIVKGHLMFCPESGKFV